MLFGANDGQDVLFEGKVLKVGTKAWQEVYAKRVGEAMDILTEGGRRVYSIGNPIMKDFGYRERVAMMNHIYEAEARKHPGVTFISTWKLMADAKGSYSDYLTDANGDSILMRAPDGIHLTRAGGDRMAALVLSVIEKELGDGRLGVAQAGALSATSRAASEGRGFAAAQPSVGRAIGSVVDPVAGDEQPEGQPRVLPVVAEAAHHGAVGDQLALGPAHEACVRGSRPRVEHRTGVAAQSAA